MSIDAPIQPAENQPAENQPAENQPAENQPAENQPAENQPAAARVIDGHKVYGSGDTEIRALDGVTVDFGQGRFTAIMGPSGSGKSTLMHCAAGLDNLTSGSAYIGDTELGSLSDRDLTLLRREQIGFVFQAFNLLPTLTAIENVNLPLTLANRKADAGWLDQIITSTGIGDRLDHRPNELSGGQQQRVAIARALVSRPSIVFADEPTGNLDSVTGGEVLDFLREAVDDLGQTLVLVTHDASAAARADRVLFLADGQIVDQIDQPSADAIFDRIKELGG